MKVKVVRINAKSPEELLMKLVSMVCGNCDCTERMPEDIEVGSESSVTIDYFIEELARKKGWKPEKVAGYLDNISELNPSATFNILLREIAIYLDKKYEDHIENSEKIYGISTLDGRIHEICKAHVKNYRNFAAFRTIEDAKFAYSLLRGQLKCMFKTNAKSK